MESGLPSNAWLKRNGFCLAPINGSDSAGPLTVCALVRRQPDQHGGWFELIEESPTQRVYLGVVCDKDARIQEWVRVCVQALDVRSLDFSGYQETATNRVFDERWMSEHRLHLSHLPASVIVTGMETINPSPLMIRTSEEGEQSPFAVATIAQHQLCRDDTVLESAGLPPYSNSPFRYLHEPTSDGTKGFIAVTPDAPTNERVQPLQTLKGGSDGSVVFNPHAGFISVTREWPLTLDDHLRILEGEKWEGCPRHAQTVQRGLLTELQNWSGGQKGFPFLLHSKNNPGGRLNEILFLKLSLLKSLMEEVRTYTKTLQLPLLNVSPTSFVVDLENVGHPFPALWTAKCSLSKPGQTHPLEIRSTAQRHFIRLGTPEPSPFLPEGLAVHSRGMGQVRIRTVIPEADGVVVEGTLIAEEYLGVNPNDLLCLTLPAGDKQLAFYAHVHTDEAGGPKEARFRTVPTHLDESVTATLKSTAGTVFPKSHYEVWPLASSPCDLYSLGILGIRILLANNNTNLPVMVDDVLSVARSLGSHPVEENQLPAQVRSLIERDAAIGDLLSPHSLMGEGVSPEQARSLLGMDLWWDTVTLLLRLFPGTGAHSYCKDFGDVSPVALDTAFDGPVEALESLVCRLRSILVPTLTSNEEIANVLLAELDAI